MIFLSFLFTRPRKLLLQNIFLWSFFLCTRLFRDCFGGCCVARTEAANRRNTKDEKETQTVESVMQKGDCERVCLWAARNSGKRATLGEGNDISGLIPKSRMKPPLIMFFGDPWFKAQEPKIHKHSQKSKTSQPEKCYCKIKSRCVCGCVSSCENWEFLRTRLRRRKFRAERERIKCLQHEPRVAAIGARKKENVSWFS